MGTFGNGGNTSENMKRIISAYYVLILLLFGGILALPEMAMAFTPPVKVPLYRIFEATVTNNKPYSNPFTDVELQVRFTSPSGENYDFYGFFDGDGAGGRDGNIWKIRFMPDETGRWEYEYKWPDNSKGGNGAFDCVAENAGKGILRAYRKNPRWFAYNGEEPVWLRSYYETGHGSIGQDLDWIVEHVYQPLYDRGYNHLQANWLLSLCCFGQYYLDGPEPETLDLVLYEEGDLWGTMNLDVWRRMERHLGWLNDHNMAVHMFLGVDGSRNEGPAWKSLTEDQKEQFTKYMVARLAPFANLAGWNYVWEVPGDREDEELGFARLVMKYDIFDHLRTYEDEFPRDNEYDREVYSFAAIENHRIASGDKDEERHLWKEAWTHHMACIVGYEGKPVFMSEGNALWRRFWSERTGATRLDLMRSAWACATAGASFTWNGHAKEYELYAGGEMGLPFNDENPYRESEEAISVLARVMNEELDFFRMEPHDELLKQCDYLSTYCLAEPGQQYLVYSINGGNFHLSLEPGHYKLKWIKPASGEAEPVKEIQVAAGSDVGFIPPDKNNDWVLVMKRIISE